MKKDIHKTNREGSVDRSVCTWFAFFHFWEGGGGCGGGWDLEWGGT